MVSRIPSIRLILVVLDKLPMSLIRDGQETTNGLKKHEAKATIETAPFAEVFGPKASRKRVKLNVSTIADLADDAQKSLGRYHERQEELKLLSGNSGVDADGTEAIPVEEETTAAVALEPIFKFVTLCLKVEEVHMLTYSLQQGQEQTDLERTLLVLSAYFIPMYDLLTTYEDKVIDASGKTPITLLS